MLYSLHYCSTLELHTHNIKSFRNGITENKGIWYSKGWDCIILPCLTSPLRHTIIMSTEFSIFFKVPTSYTTCHTAYLKHWSLTSLGSIMLDFASNPAIWQTSQRTPVGKQCMLLRRLSTNRFVIVTRHLLVHLRYSCSRTLYSGDPSGPNFFRRSSGGNLKIILQTS